MYHFGESAFFFLFLVVEVVRPPKEYIGPVLTLPLWLGQRAPPVCRVLGIGTVTST